MQLGALATVGMLQPRNLAIVVMDNASYQITGGQPTATAAGADIVAIARGAGIERSSWADDEAAFEALMDRTLEGDGPWLVAARIDGEPAVEQTERDPAQLCDRFMRGLGVKK
jgi:thiamine pyrophosphate-dependent acetolactate synthase large subunit-like protein